MITAKKIKNLAEEKGINFVKSSFAWEFLFRDRSGNEQRCVFTGPNKNKRAYSFLNKIDAI